MGQVFTDPRADALFHQLFDTPERRAQLAELVGILLQQPAIAAPVGWDGERVGEAVRQTAEEVGPRDWAQAGELAWPSAASASSTYGGGWSPQEVLGPPKVFPAHGDLRGAWAPAASVGGVQWLEVTFPEELPEARGVLVFETNHPGAVYAITDEDAQGQALWKDAPLGLTDGARLLRVRFAEPRKVRRLRLWLDTRLTGSWNEIDTVALVLGDEPPTTTRETATAVEKRGGRRARGPALTVVPTLRGPSVGEGKRHGTGAARKLLAAEGAQWRWCQLASASSSYGEGWEAQMVVGPPKVFPSYGDRQGAWAPRGYDDGVQWLELRWAEPLAAKAAVIFETNLPGAVYAVSAGEKDPTTVVWQKPPSRSAHEAQALVIALDPEKPVGVLRLWVNTDGLNSWPEIDAVALVPV